MPRIVKLHVEVETSPPTTDFNVQFSADLATWTPYSSSSSTPSSPEDLAVGVLDANSEYTLDGINAPTGNEEAASDGPWYRLRLKNAGGYGNWSTAFSVRGYPTAEDLTALLTGYGLTVDAGQVQAAVLAGIESFESAVNRHMLAGKSIDNGTQAPQTRTYLPPDNWLGILDLDGDLAAAPTVVYQPQGSSSETFTILTDYRLDPENGPAMRRPYERIQFLRRWYQPAPWSFGAAIQVTGLWGYGTTIPEDAWRAMLNGGLLWLVGQAWSGSSAPLKSWAEADVKEEYAVPTWTERRAVIEAETKSVVGRYRKVSL